MKISIGLLAHNEEDAIASMINQVFEQDIFLSETSEIEFIVVANGCTDHTVMVAEAAFKNMSGKLLNASYEVRVVVEAGKSNAWNKFVHEFSDPVAEYLILLDADIEFGSSNLLSRLIEELQSNPTAVASVDRPKKDIEKQLNKSLLARLSIGVSGANQNGRSVISGQLYCMRGDIIRKIYMPIGLPVEDGFLRAMVVTDNFTHEDEPLKIIAVNDVHHYFEALLSPIKLYKHEKRLLIGSVINMMVYRYLWKKVAETGNDAGVLIEKLNKDEPNWLNSLINAYKLSEGFWIVKKDLFLKRIIQLIKGDQQYRKKLLLFPIVLLATMVSTAIALDVNNFFRKNNGLGHW